MISQFISKPNILLPKRHVLLLSHMRANTSLIGHIIGSSEEVSGYYEMHIGYYSWKSLLRQQLLYHSKHPSEPVTNYYFDKVLHSEHDVTKDILNSRKVNLIFMLRSPERSIKSIIKLYQRVEPEHEFATIDGAVKYYSDRVQDIGDLIDNIADVSKTSYIDSECLVNKTEDALNFLTDRIGLKIRLTPEYKKFELTGKEKFGDSSSKIDIGRVSKSRENYDDIKICNDCVKGAEEIYSVVRDKLIQKCQDSLTN